MNLLDEFFLLLETEIDRFVDESYAPYIISYSIREFALVDRLSEAEPTDQPDLLQDHVSTVSDDIEDYRAELMAPVTERRDQLEDAVVTSYKALHYAVAGLVGYLQSVHAVTQEQMQILDIAGLGSVRDDAITSLTNIAIHVDGVGRHAEQMLSAGAQGADNGSVMFDGVAERIREELGVLEVEE